MTINKAFFDIGIYGLSYYECRICLETDWQSAFLLPRINCRYISVMATICQFAHYMAIALSILIVPLLFIPPLVPYVLRISSRS